MTIKIFKTGKVKSNIILLTCFCLLINIIYAQKNYKHYNALDGLAHDITYNLYQDSNGYIWIGTDDGLSKFDGTTFTNFTSNNGLKSNFVTDILELKHNTYALATWGKGLHFLQNDTIVKNEIFKDEDLKIYKINKAKNIISGYSGSSFFFYNLKYNTFYLKKFSKNIGFTANEINETYNLLDASVINDTLYFHDQDSYVNDYKGVFVCNENFKITTKFSFLNEYRIGALLKTKAYYVAGSDNKLIFFKPSGIDEIIELKLSFSNQRIVKIIETPKANVFIIIARNKDGLKHIFQFDKNTNSTINLIEKLNIKTSISDAIFDFENNLWISTFGDGVYCYYYNNPDVDNFLNGNYIVDLVVKDEQIFALTPSELYQIDKKQNLTSYAINGFAKSLNLSNSNIKISALDLVNDSQSKLFSTINARFYAETDYGAIRQSDTLFLGKNILNIGNELIVKKVIQKQNEIDFYTNKGKWKYNVNQKTFVKDTIFSAKLLSENINDYLFNANKEYIATDKGLIVIDNNSKSIYNEQNGLQNERINCILIVNEKIFLGTQSGLSIIENDQVFNISKSFGLQSLAINKIIYRNNALWLGGNNGISVIHINDIKASIAPKLIIKQNNSIFNYSVVTYQDKNALKMDYNLNSQGWKSLSESQGNLDFTNLNPDIYNIQFRVQNSSSLPVYSEEFNFKINQVWYRQWWVLILAILLSATLGSLLFYSRLKQIAKRNLILKNEIDKRIVAEKELKEVRHNIARDFHDDLGNKLASISLLSDVLSKKVDKKVGSIVKTIKDDADHLYKGTKDFIFSLQEESNYVEELFVYLKDFAEDYLYQFSIDFEVHSNIEKNLKLPHYWSKQIIFIFKEVITNVVKHSSATNVKMEFKLIHDELSIEVVDNGIGFIIDDKSKRGLENMVSRAVKINCQLVIKSEIEKGSKVLFKGKLPQ